MHRDHPVARLVPLKDKKGIEVREPLQPFGFQRLAPLMKGGSLEPTRKHNRNAHAAHRGDGERVG